MHGFDYGLADEVHELKERETARGTRWERCFRVRCRTIVLTGTLLGGYTETNCSRSFSGWTLEKMMRAEGFDYGETGVRQFAEAYGVLEKVTTIEPAENACSKARTTTSIKRRPGALPASVRQVPHEYGGLRVARRHFGRSAFL